MSNTIIVNNKPLSRGRSSVHLLLCPNRGIIQFNGRSIPPVVKVVRRDETKDGKWSHETWKCEVAEGYALLQFRQEFETGKYFPVATWQEATNHLNEALGGKPREMGITDSMMERAIRTIFPTAAASIDAAEENFKSAGDAVEELLLAQEELVKAKEGERRVWNTIQGMEEAERMRQEAASTRERVDKANALLKGGKAVSLADLRAAMGS